MSLKKIDMKLVQNLAIENLSGLPEIHRKNSERQYVYIGNIPQTMHASDLRNFFKDFKKMHLNASTFDIDQRLMQYQEQT